MVCVVAYRTPDDPTLKRRLRVRDLFRVGFVLGDVEVNLGLHFRFGASQIPNSGKLNPKFDQIFQFRVSFDDTKLTRKKSYNFGFCLS